MAKWEDQYVDQHDYIKVTTDYSRKDIDTSPRTDFLLIDRQENMKKHISIDQNGNMSTWHGWIKQ